MKRAVNVVVALTCALIGYLSFSAVFGRRGEPQSASNHWRDGSKMAVEQPPTPTSSAQSEATMAEALERLEELKQQSSLPGPRHDEDHKGPNDPEWVSLPRGVAGLIRLCSYGAVDLDARRLFRSTELNPRDTFIPAEQRAILTTLLEALHPSLDAAFQARLSIYGQDFDYALASGSARELKTKPVRETKTNNLGQSVEVDTIQIGDLRSEGVDMAFSKNGVVFGASRADHEASNVAMQQAKFLGLEVGCAIVEWFHSVGTLERAEADAIRALLFQ